MLLQNSILSQRRSSDANLSTKFQVKGGHFLAEDPRAFDAGFFNVNKTEVLSLDPQQRIVMENVYHALENGKCFLIFGECHEFPLCEKF